MFLAGLFIALHAQEFPSKETVFPFACADEPRLPQAKLRGSANLLLSLAFAMTYNLSLYVLRSLCLDQCLLGDLQSCRRLTLPQGNSRTEKRRWQRVALPVPVFVRGTDELGKEFLEFSTALNISRGGALLATRRYLAPSAMISIQIPPPPFPSQSLPQPVVGNLEAKVVQVRPANRYHLSGLSFTHPLSAD